MDPFCFSRGNGSSRVSEGKMRVVAAAAATRSAAWRGDVLRWGVSAKRSWKEMLRRPAESYIVDERDSRRKAELLHATQHRSDRVVLALSEARMVVARTQTQRRVQIYPSFLPECVRLLRNGRFLWNVGSGVCVKSSSSGTVQRLPSPVRQDRVVH